MRTAQSRLEFADDAWALGHDKNDRNVMVWALAAAVGVHLLFLLVHLPSATLPDAPPDDPPPMISRTRILPPRPPEHRVPRDRRPNVPRRLLPVPEASPPEPVEERVSMLVDSEVSALDMPLLIEDVTEPPRPPEPVRAGSYGVTNPVLIADSKVEPDYPELARAARLGGRVILEAVIRRDGTVAEITVLQCTRPDLGFEEAAIEAIRQWRYEPGRQNGVPVDVYFTVVVEFALQ